MAEEYKDIWALVFKRDQIFIFFSLIFIIVLSWIYIIHLNSLMLLNSMDMNSVAGQISMPKYNQWSIDDLILALLMWTMMMLAMMLPSAAPMILIFSAVNKKRHGEGRQLLPTWIFVAGYILIWILFAILAVALQWFLHSLAILSPDLKLVSLIIGGTVLVLAGIYQFTPVKNVCVKNCQSPLGFVMEHWQDGKKGSFIMGLRHGTYCLGCCWALMLILFVAGVMNLLWIAIISMFIFIEKITTNRWIGRIVGILLITSGLGLIINII